MERRNLLEILDELRQSIETSEAPRESSLMTVGFAIGLALHTGWTVGELVALRMWPKPDPPR